MIMPVRQRCPSCGRLFMGSDAIGRPCIDCELLEIRLQHSRTQKQTTQYTDQEADVCNCSSCIGNK